MSVLHYVENSRSTPQMDFPPTTLVELLQFRAVNQGDRHAYTFLNDYCEEAARFTYLDLHKKAKAIAGCLQSFHLEGERALLIYPAGLDFIAAFFGCLYAGVVAAPFPVANPSHPARSLAKLRAIAADAQPAIVLTVSRLSARLQEVYGDLEELKCARWFTTDELPENQGCQWRSPDLHGDMLAYLQYTSGSTARPRGVMVTHANVLHGVKDMDETCQHTDDSAIVSWLPHYHDLGLVYGIIEPLYTGISCYLMAPVTFVKRPFRWLEAISNYRATHTAAPNFAYDLCVRRVSQEQLAKLDLSNWQVALDGAEPVRKETMDRFAATFEPCGFRARSFCPGYGLAEATLKVSATFKDTPPSYVRIRSDDLKEDRVVESIDDGKGSQTLVSCGRTGLGTEAIVVRPDSLKVCGDNEVGEIWISGPQVTCGYWNRPQETEQTFNAFVGGRGPFLRTGDLGFIKNGEMFITGRLKDMIIIAGRNHYPQDIELTVESSHEALRPGSCAAFSVDLNGEERLVVAAEVDRRYNTVDSVQSFTEADDSVEGRTEQTKLVIDNKISITQQSIMRAIRSNISFYHDVDVHEVVLIRTSSLPKTSSGKIQRHTCKAGFLENRLVLWDRA